MPEPYLTRLTGRLIDGAAKLPNDFRDRHGSWLVGRQNADGGFSGREGPSDLYYTGFALRGLAVLGGLTPEVADRAAEFLRSRTQGQGSVVDLFSLLVGTALVRLAGGADVLADAAADWPERVSALLETFRTADGGYGKTAGAASGSTYTSFLVALARELLGKPVPDADRLVAFVKSRRRQDGGYVEIAPMRRSGANPTAAGVGVLQTFDALDAEARSAVADFIVGLKSEFEGGIRANGVIPAADLLSTFTGSWTLASLDALDLLDVQAIRDYAESVERPTGGFMGGLWDDQVDVEYTFYGVGVLALLAE